MNLFGFCNLSVVPCRREPSDRSEMTTQLLFGEHFEILEEHKSWVYISSAIDGYKSWIDRKQYLPISKETFDKLSAEAYSRTSDIVGIITETTENISFPSLLLAVDYHCSKERISLLKNKKYKIFREVLQHPVQNPKGQRLLKMHLSTSIPLICGAAVHHLELTVQGSLRWFTA